MPALKSQVTSVSMLPNERMGPLFAATVQATEEAIVNALCMADEMRGPTGHVAPALPLDRLAEILGRYRAAFSPPRA